MTIAILTILASLLPLLVWWVRRRAASNDDPYHQHEEHREQIAREIIHNDEAAANQSLDVDLDRLSILHSIRCEGGSPTKETNEKP